MATLKLKLLRTTLWRNYNIFEVIKKIIKEKSSTFLHENKK